MSELGRRNDQGIRRIYPVIFLLAVILLIGSIINLMRWNRFEIDKIMVSNVSKLYDFFVSDADRAIRERAEEVIRIQSQKISEQVGRYIDAHPKSALTDLIKSPEFRAVAVQPVGRTGYTALFDSKTSHNCLHSNPKFEGINLIGLRDQLPDFVRIIDQTHPGEEGGGYYKWREETGIFKEKFMWVSPVKTSRSELKLAVAATAYIDEFLQSNRELSVNLFNATEQTYQAIEALNKKTTYLSLARIFGIITVFLIIILAMNMSLIKKQSMIEKKLRVESLMAAIASGYAGIAPDRISEQIKESLKLMLGLTDVDRCYLLSFSSDQESIEFIYESHLPGCSPIPEERIVGVRLNDIPHVKEMAEKKRLMKIEDINQFSFRSAREKAIWELLGIKSVLGVPLSDRTRSFGILCFQNDRKKRRWSIEDTAALALLGNVLTNVLLYKQSCILADGYRKRLEDIINFLPDATFVIDAQRKVIAWNKACENFTGVSSVDMLGKGNYEYSIPFYGVRRASFVDLIFEPGLNLDENKYSEIESDGKSITVETFAPAVNQGRGAQIIIKARPLYNSSGKIGGAIESVRDISDRVKAEQELINTYNKLRETQSKLVQSAKMAAIGQLASGVAHEINNPLTGVLNNVQLIKLEVQQKKEFTIEDFREMLDVIEESALRCKNITSSLLDFARVSAKTSAPVDLNEVIEKVLNLIGHEMNLQNITIDKKLASDLPKINGDVQLMQQVFINLIGNSKWAIEQKNSNAGGVISIKTSFNAESALVYVTVSDDGIGISKENLDHIFEPFFTTKPIGEGTGLGLSVAYGIIRDYHGLINFESGEGVGTRVKICFPATIKAS